MGLSSQLAVSAIARPGVCTSSTRPASPYDGQVIYETDTDKTLVWNGSAWVFLSTSTANPVGLELIKTQTIGSAVSSVEVTSAFSSSFDVYRIIVSGGTQSVSYPNLQFQFSGITTGVYYGGFFGTKFDTGAVSGLGVNGATSWTYAGIGASGGNLMDITIFGANSTTRKFCSSGFYHTSAAIYGMFTGECTGTTAETAFKIIPSSGTLTGGTIRVYGYKN